MMEKEKLVVKIIGWFFLIIGTINVIGKLIPLVTGQIGGQIDIFNLVGIIAGVGILKMKKWARVLGIALSAIGILIIALLFNNIMKQAILLVFSLTFIFIYIAIVYFLTRPKVKEQFR